MDARQYAPATQRNREPILKVLSEILPAQSKILEIASGTGEHALYFASELDCCWIPSDPNPLARESITAWQNTCGLDNLELPLSIDASADDWYRQLENREINAIVNINMIHISPWEACLGLFEGARAILPPGGVLYLYGPYKRDGEHTAASNASFDRSLRDRNPAWGIRDLERVVAAAAAQNLKLEQVVNMPANNLSVVFTR